MAGMLFMNYFYKKFSLVVLLILIVLMGNGCALLQLPFTILNQVLSIVNKLPKPPPGVF